MRAILFFLLAANLAFFGYHSFYAAKDDAVVEAKTQEQMVSGAGLKLLTEQSGSSVLRARPKDEPKKPVSVSVGEKSEAEFCTMIGPYSQLLQAEYAVERLTALGVPAHITPVEIKDGESYWVYLRPEVSEKEALRRLYELQKKNIESHIITKGELSNGISFGRFADYSDAEGRSAEIKKQGYEVDIKMLPKMIQETWVVIDTGFAEKIDETVWADLLSQESTLEKRQNFCLGVASQ